MEYLCNLNGLQIVSHALMTSTRGKSKLEKKERKIVHKLNERAMIYEQHMQNESVVSRAVLCCSVLEQQNVGSG